jgi:hypothetical protein
MLVSRPSTPESTPSLVEVLDEETVLSRPARTPLGTPPFTTMSWMDQSSAATGWPMGEPGEAGDELPPEYVARAKQGERDHTFLSLGTLWCEHRLHAWSIRSRRTGSAACSSSRRPTRRTRAPSTTSPSRSIRSFQRREPRPCAGVGTQTTSSWASSSASLHETADSTRTHHLDKMGSHAGDPHYHHGFTAGGSTRCNEADGIHV